MLKLWRVIPAFRACIISFREWSKSVSGFRNFCPSRSLKFQTCRAHDVTVVKRLTQYNLPYQRDFGQSRQVLCWLHTWSDIVRIKNISFNFESDNGLIRFKCLTHENVLKRRSLLHESLGNPRKCFFRNRVHTKTTTKTQTDDVIVWGDLNAAQEVVWAIRTGLCVCCL